MKSSARLDQSGGWRGAGRCVRGGGGGPGGPPPPPSLHTWKAPGVEMGDGDGTRRDPGKVLLGREIPQGRETVKVTGSAGSHPRAWTVSTGTVTVHLKGRSRTVGLSGGGILPAPAPGSSLASPGPDGLQTALQGPASALALLDGPASHTPEPLGPLCPGHRRLARE